MSDRNCGLVEGAGNTAGSEKVLRDSETEWPAVKSFRGRLVLKERSIADVVLSLGEVAAPSKSGRVEWWGQCRLAQQLRESVGAIVGEAAIELEDGRIGKILIADFRAETGYVRFSGNGELKVSHDRR